jgi:diguanylate cyclase (GGDEF)-like protein/PAS domain S-box-containing protein
MIRDSDTPELESPEILRSVLDSLEAGVCLCSRSRKIVFWSQGAEKIGGYQRHGVVGHHCRENILASCNDVSCALCGGACPLTQALNDGRTTESEVYLHHKAGHRVPVRLRVCPIRNPHGSVVAMVVSFTEERSSAEPGPHEINLAAHGCLDVTSGVPNHSFTRSHLRENLAFFQEYHLPFGVLRIRVLHLDELQSTHGREAVDVMLHVVAQTMKHALLPDGFLGRWAEDEFLAIVTYCSLDELKKLSQRVEKMAGCAGIQWWDDMLAVEVAVGLAMTQPGDSLESLLERAGARENGLPLHPSPIASAGREQSER